MIKLRKKIEGMERRAITFSSLVAVAYKWVHELGDYRKARSCLKRAEEKVITLDQVLRIILEWGEVERPVYAHKWVKIYMAGSGEWDDFYSLCSKANIHRIILNLPEARRYLKRAEKEANSSCDWWDCSRGWSNMGDVENAFRCMKIAEKDPKYYGDWEACIDGWIWLDQAEDARRCLHGAEKDDSLWQDEHGSLLFWAKRWLRLGDKTEAHRCLQLMMDTVEDMYDWLEIAEVWLQLGKTSKVQQALIQAEKLVENDREWARCAKLWAQLDRGADARRCIAQAETLAADMDDWAECALEWIKLGALSKARVCMIRAENDKGPEPWWMSCAEGWMTLGDKEKAHSCIRLAEVEIEVQDNILYDWAWPMKAWADLGEADGVYRCASRAEKMAKGSHDWGVCAYLWGNLGKVEQRLNCLKKHDELLAREEKGGKL